MDRTDRTLPRPPAPPAPAPPLREAAVRPAAPPRAPETLRRFEDARAAWPDERYRGWSGL
ncbi:MAG: hypothetical protein AB7V42_03320 [Thermoleophilia bacterium]